MSAPVYATSHAVHRWRERVEPSVGWAEATASIERMAREVTRSAKPRRWLRLGGQSPAPGAVFVYWHRRPGVALVVEGSSVLTVMTRESGRMRRLQERQKREQDRPSGRRPRV